MGKFDSERICQIVVDAHFEAEELKKKEKEFKEPDLMSLYIGLECSARKLLIAQKELEIENQKELLQKDLIFIQLRKS